VIAHGTDTMSESARALASVHGKTIVFTGALSPARFSESDAAFNLGMAFAVAQTAAPGVYITMNGQVFRGDEVRKDRKAAKVRAHRTSVIITIVLRHSCPKRTSNSIRSQNGFPSLLPPIRTFEASVMHTGYSV
jgi:hypothetical protein